MTDEPINTVAASAGEAASAPGRAVVVPGLSVGGRSTGSKSGPVQMSPPGSLLLRNGQHEEFAQGVAAGLSQRDAWVAAGYSAKSNNSDRTAALPHVAARIAYLRAAFNDRVEGNGKIKLQWLQRKYIDIVVADPTKFSKIEDGACVVKDRKKLGGSATKFQIDAAGRLEIEIDRKAALDSLTRTVGGFVTKAEVSGPDGGPLEVENITDADRARALAAILARARAELEGDGVAYGLAVNGGMSDSPPPGAAGEPEPPLAAAKRALIAASQAAQGAVADGAAAEFLIRKLRGLADAVEEELARSAARSAAG
jgi:hypothetical protein